MNLTEYENILLTKVQIGTGSWK